MYKVMWVPRKYKHLKFKELAEQQNKLVEEAREVLEDVKQLERESKERLADAVIKYQYLLDMTDEEKEALVRELIFFVEGFNSGKKARDEK